MSMPELPEIAVYKKYVDATSLNKKIVEIDFPQTSLLQSPRSDFEKSLKDREINETRQVGKYLFLKTDKNHWLVLHFGMTGKLEYYQNREAFNYSHMILTFKDGAHLAFLCRRKLGKIYLSKSIEEFQQVHDLGKDALELTKKDFEELLQKKKGSIKVALTEQHLIAGIGNVYADEILYQSNIHPKTKVEKLTEKEKRGIFKQIEKVLKLAIKNNGQRSSLPSTFLIPRRKEGADCPRCSGKVEKIKISGRSTYFCPSCQKERK